MYAFLFVLILCFVFYFITFDNTISQPDYSILEIPHFLSDFECDFLIELAKHKGLFPSKVYESSADNLDDSTRKSEQCWLEDPDHPIIKRLSEKSAELTKTQGNFQELLQVVSYKPSGFFNPHYDACNGSEEFCARLNEDGGPRLATVLIYLNDDFEGGETVFPKIKKTVIPEKGKAVLFYNVNENGNPIYESLHGGNPVKSGNKYICNKWIRMGRGIS